MKRGTNFLAVALSAALLSMGCGTSSVDGGEDPRNTAPDAAAQTGDPDAAQPNTDQIPTWALVDIQPDSPRFNETYGLEEFDGKILVALLVDGF